jgi:hypothetical protein
MPRLVAASALPTSPTVRDRYAGYSLISKHTLMQVNKGGLDRGSHQGLALLALVHDAMVIGDPCGASLAHIVPPCLCCFSTLAPMRMPVDIKVGRALAIKQPTFHLVLTPSTSF